MLKFGISQDSRDNKSSLYIHITNHFDRFYVPTVFLSWYVLGCDKINISGHGEKKLNAINKHYINTERDILIFFENLFWDACDGCNNVVDLSVGCLSFQCIYIWAIYLLRQLHVLSSNRESLHHDVINNMKQFCCANVVEHYLESSCLLGLIDSPSCVLGEVLFN